MVLEGFITNRRIGMAFLIDLAKELHRSTLASKSKPRFSCFGEFLSFALKTVDVVFGSLSPFFLNESPTQVSRKPLKDWTSHQSQKHSNLRVFHVEDL